jgi:hypothetical protein
MLPPSSEYKSKLHRESNFRYRKWREKLWAASKPMGDGSPYMGKERWKRGKKNSRKVQMENTGWSVVSESVKGPGRVLSRLNHADPHKGRKSYVLPAEKGLTKRRKELKSNYSIP